LSTSNTTKHRNQFTLPSIFEQEQEQEQEQQQRENDDIQKSRALQSTTASWALIGDSFRGAAADSNLGRGVAISEDGLTVAVGAPESFPSPSTYGYVQVFVRLGASWVQLGSTLQALDPDNSDDLFGFSVSLSANGRILAVGAPYLSTSTGSASGATFVYEFVGSDWQLLGQQLNGEGSYVYSGWSVALSDTGSRLAVGSYLNDGGGNNAGHVRVYEYDSFDTWNILGQDLDGVAADDWTGYACALSGDGTSVAVPGRNNDDGGLDSGIVRIFVYNDDLLVWVQLGQNVYGASNGDRFGYSVSLTTDGLTFVSGALNANDGGSSSGHLRVFEYNDSTLVWEQKGQTIGGENTGDLFGYSSSINSDGSVILGGGHRGRNNAYERSGYVAAFQWDDTQWELIDVGIYGESSGDSFGVSVQLNALGDAFVAGGYHNDVSANNAGFAQVYNMLEPTPAPSVLPSIAPSDQPSLSPSSSLAPSTLPSSLSVAPSVSPSTSSVPSKAPSAFPSLMPSDGLTMTPVPLSSMAPSVSIHPSDAPSFADSAAPSVSIKPSDGPTTTPVPLSSSVPSVSIHPSDAPSFADSGAPSVSIQPSDGPTSAPVLLSSIAPSVSIQPSDAPSFADSAAPSVSIQPSDGPTTAYVPLSSSLPSVSIQPSDAPSFAASAAPSVSIQLSDALTSALVPLSSTAPSLFSSAPSPGPAGWSEVGLALEGELDGDEFGKSVAMSADGNVIAIGAPSHDGSGAVYVYELTGGTTWTLRGDPILGVEPGDDAGLSVALSADGLTVVIGAPYSGQFDNGSVRVFEYSGAAWTQTGQTLVGPGSYKYGGWSVAVSSNGSVIAYGAYRGGGSGQVFVFFNNLGTWEPRGLPILGDMNGDRAGWSVDLSDSGDIVAIGSPENGSSGDLYSGHVRVFQYDSGLETWTMLGSEIAGVAAMDNFGYAVALSSNGLTVAATAINADDAGPSSGHLRVFAFDGNDWVVKGNTISGARSGDLAGSSCTISGDGNTVAFGSHRNDGTANNAGLAQIFQYNVGTWLQKGDDILGTAAGSSFGISMALSASGDELVVGGTGPMSTIATGHVRIFTQ
jgi:hypothetical protein